MVIMPEVANRRPYTFFILFFFLLHNSPHKNIKAGADHRGKFQLLDPKTKELRKMPERLVPKGQWWHFSQSHLVKSKKLIKFTRSFPPTKPDNIRHQLYPRKRERLIRLMIGPEHLTL